MKPLWNAPSFGTVQARASRLWVLLLALGYVGIAMPLLVFSPYFVIVRAAWMKHPAMPWRCSVIISLLLAIVAVCLCSPLVFPGGLPFSLPPNDANSVLFMPMVTMCIVTINAALVAGIALLPLAMASTINRARGAKR